MLASVVLLLQCYNSVETLFYLRRSKMIYCLVHMHFNTHNSMCTPGARTQDTAHWFYSARLVASQDFCAHKSGMRNVIISVITMQHWFIQQKWLSGRICFIFDSDGCPRQRHSSGLLMVNQRLQGLAEKERERKRVGRVWYICGLITRF